MTAPRSSGALLVLAGVLLLPGAARAEDPAPPGAPTTATPAASTPAASDEVRVPAAEAARAPRSDAMIGAADGFATAQLARRVMAEGDAYTFAGRLRKAEPATAARVACPYRAGEGDGACIVATELVERLDQSGITGGTVSLEGRILEVDGLRYVVLVAYRAADT